MRTPDESLGDMRSGVKKKLRVSEDVEIKLVQLPEGRAVDLEDGTTGDVHFAKYLHSLLQRMISKPFVHKLS